jgi:SAM-dependent methyltransferase
VIAVENSIGFLAYLEKKRAAQVSWNNVEILYASDSDPELEPNSIDLVFMCDVYHHLEKPVIFFKPLKQTLNKDARIVVIDFYRDPNKVTSRPPEWVLQHVRADQATFRREIESSGFAHVRDLEAPGLSENYIMLFQ